MDEFALITTYFIKLMKPLVPSQKLALQIVGEPVRTKEIQLFRSVIDIARTNKLHRNVRHALSSITLDFNADRAFLKGTHIVLNGNSVTLQDYNRRMTITLVLIFLLLAFVFLNK
jgi:hypothetical protein